MVFDGLISSYNKDKFDVFAHDKELFFKIDKHNYDVLHDCDNIDQRWIKLKIHVFNRPGNTDLQFHRRFRFVQPVTLIHQQRRPDDAYKAMVYL